MASFLEVPVGESLVELVVALFVCKHKRTQREGMKERRGEEGKRKRAIINLIGICIQFEGVFAEKNNEVPTLTHGALCR